MLFISTRENFIKYVTIKYIEKIILKLTNENTKIDILISINLFFLSSIYFSESIKYFLKYLFHFHILYQLK